MTTTTTDTKQGRPLTVSENKTAQNVQKKENKMELLNDITIENDQKMKIHLSKNSSIDIESYNGTIYVGVRHHHTEPENVVRFNKYSDHTEGTTKWVSWSSCDSSYIDQDKKVIVDHTAFNKHNR